MAEPSPKKEKKNKSKKSSNKKKTDEDKAPDGTAAHVSPQPSQQQLPEDNQSKQKTGEPMPSTATAKVSVVEEPEVMSLLDDGKNNVEEKEDGEVGEKKDEEGDNKSEDRPVGKGH
ncbi:hypothetical protein A2U01_0061461, partial [Trifolium medium]|nr:hypothetical protein [Trifolium medium]